MGFNNDTSNISFDENGKFANCLFSSVMFPLALIYFEIILHISTNIAWTSNSFLYVLLTSFVFGLFLFSLSTFFTFKVNRWIVFTLTFVIGFVYAIYTVYYYFFKAFVDFSMMGEAGNMINDFFLNIVSCTLKNLHWIFLLLLPSFVYLILTKRMLKVERTSWKQKAAFCAVALALAFTRTGLIALNDTEYSDKYYYNEGYDATISATRFGLVTSIRLNAKYTVFGMPEKEIEINNETESVDIGGLFGTTKPNDSTNPPNTGSSDTTGSNGETSSNGESTGGGESGTVAPPEPFIPVEQIQVDFNQLIQNESNKDIKKLHEYFASVTPTKTNAYTGMFKGKNLIYITAEGFSSKIIDPNLTPTLYKMFNEGFVFKNSYNSLWGGSTASGEYLSLTGNFYGPATCLDISGGGADGNKRLMYYALGNTFKREGYPTIAFHNNTYTYYSRNLSHPNMGFDQFIAANDKNYSAGITYPTSAWPKSDEEMAMLSTSYYIDSATPFLAYYMTVSGHANYNWYGNNMSKKHQSEVQHLNYSEEVKAYIACNLELELMVKNLIEQLEAKGKLDDTVFVISADHYPYSLSDSALAELYGLPEEGLRDNLELFRNQFTIWSSSMEKPVIVDKYCSSMDIIPTVYNLFGINYDSRLLTGIDLMSDAPGLVIINTHKTYWNWITDYGSYERKAKKFTPHEGVSIGDSSQLDKYIRNINTLVNGKQTASPAILDKDYYRYVFK